MLKRKKKGLKWMHIQTEKCLNGSNSTDEGIVLHHVIWSILGSTSAKSLASLSKPY